MQRRIGSTGHCGNAFEALPGFGPRPIWGLDGPRARRSWRRRVPRAIFPPEPRHEGNGVRGRGGVAVAMIGLAACTGPADLVLVNGRIWTGTGDTASAIAVRAGRVVAVGTADDVERWAG